MATHLVGTKFRPQTQALITGVKTGYLGSNRSRASQNGHPDPTSETVRSPQICNRQKTSLNDTCDPTQAHTYTQQQDFSSPTYHEGAKAFQDVHLQSDQRVGEVATDASGQVVGVVRNCLPLVLSCRNLRGKSSISFYHMRVGYFESLVYHEVTDPLKGPVN